MTRPCCAVNERPVERRRLVHSSEGDDNTSKLAASSFSELSDVASPPRPRSLATAKPIFERHSKNSDSRIAAHNTITTIESISVQERVTASFFLPRNAKYLSHNVFSVFVASERETDNEKMLKIDWFARNVRKRLEENKNNVKQRARVLKN